MSDKPTLSELTHSVETDSADMACFIYEHWVFEDNS
jgi:hypothetical protein